MKLHQITIRCEYENMKELVSYFLKNDIYWDKEIFPHSVKDEDGYYNDDKKRFDWWLKKEHRRSIFDFYLLNGSVIGYDYTMYNRDNSYPSFKIIPFLKD